MSQRAVQVFPNSRKTVVESGHIDSAKSFIRSDDLNVIWRGTAVPSDGKTRLVAYT
jgi:hypothetical protein